MAKKKSFLEKYFGQPVLPITFRVRPEEPPRNYAEWNADESPNTTDYIKHPSGEKYPWYLIVVCKEPILDYTPEMVGHATGFSKFYGLGNIHVLGGKIKYFAEVTEPRKNSPNLRRPMKPEEVSDFYKDFSFQLEDFPDKNFLAVLRGDLDGFYAEALEKLPQDWETYKKSGQSKKIIKYPAQPAS